MNGKLTTAIIIVVIVFFIPFIPMGRVFLTISDIIPYIGIYLPGAVIYHGHYFFYLYLNYLLFSFPI